MLEESSSLLESLPLPGGQFLEFRGFHFKDCNEIVISQMHLFASDVDASWQVLWFALQHCRRVLDVIIEIRGSLRGHLRSR